MNNAEQKHNSLVDIVYNEVLKNNDPSEVFHEAPYDLGICDVLLVKPTHQVYFEVKYNETKIGFKKAFKQLKRWSEYNRHYDKDTDYIGVYVSSNVRKPVIKNGKSII